MYLFGKVLPLLFTSPSSLQSSCATPSIDTSIVSSMTISHGLRISSSLSSSSADYTGTPAVDHEQDEEALIKEILSPPRQVIQDVQNTYRELAKGCYSTKDYYSPSIEFKYVSPSHVRQSGSFTFTSSELSQVDDENDIEIEEEGTHSNMLRQTTSSNKHKNELEQVYAHIQSTYSSSLPNENDKKKKICLYLPGLDGVGISGTQQFDDLSNNFEFWRMSIETYDRSTFTELTTIITKFIQDLVLSQNRELIIIGESFGGLLAPSVALRLQALSKLQKIDYDPLEGLVLVNPATSFERTQWSTFAPLLASLRHIEQDNTESGSSRSSNAVQNLLPSAYSVVGGVALAAVIPDSTQFRTILNMITSTKVENRDELSDVLLAMKDGFGILADNLPAEVVEYRVGNWLTVGCDVVNPRLGTLHVSTLVIAGADDKMLPTNEEADRLVQVIPNCTSMIVKGSGHFVLDDRFNLTEAIADAPFDPSQKNKNTKKYDPILDWKPPSPNVIKETIESNVKPLRTLTSPVFFSTGEDGKRRAGLGHVPKKINDKPILFVANHQLLGLDLGLIIAELTENRNINARGLAHPIIFQGGNFGASPERQVQSFNRDGRISEPGTFQTFGAVMVTPRNFYRLMETGQTGLLFPGGVREVFHGKDEAYELFWPEKVDFVRIAARFNATIVPISAIGAADSANILIDAPDILNLPFGLGERAANNTRNTIAARYDANENEELFQPPLVVPKLLPSRHYFVFGEAFDTTYIGHKDKEQCAKLYSDVKTELRRGLDDLLVAREKDPFKDTAGRLIYERVYGKSAPSFPIDELNK